MLSGGGELRRSNLVRVGFRFFFLFLYSTRRAVLSIVSGSARARDRSIFWLACEDISRRLLPRLESPRGDMAPDTDRYRELSLCKFDIFC